MMISTQDIEQARERLLDRTVAYFTERPEVVGVLLVGSLAAGTADTYSDIDLHVIAPPDTQAGLVAERLELPAHWGDLLFNEWLVGTFHCVSHFRPFVKIDVWYLSTEMLQPSPWLKMPSRILLDRTGLVRQAVERSAELPFPRPDGKEVSRILSKALAAAHEVVRRVRRGELFFAHSLLDELRSYLMRLDRWTQPSEVARALDVGRERRVSETLRSVLEESYVGLDGVALETAVVDLSAVLARLIPRLHRTFALDRSLATDVEAAEVVRQRLVA